MEHCPVIYHGYLLVIDWMFTFHSQIQRRGAGERDNGHVYYTEYNTNTVLIEKLAHTQRRRSHFDRPRSNDFLKGIYGLLSCYSLPCAIMTGKLCDKLHRLCLYKLCMDAFEQRRSTDQINRGDDAFISCRVMVRWVKIMTTSMKWLHSSSRV